MVLKKRKNYPKPNNSILDFEARSFTTGVSVRGFNLFFIKYNEIVATQTAAKFMGD